MSIIQRILREKVLLGSLGTAVVGLLVLLGVDPTLMGSIALVVAALIALLRAVVTPTSEVLVQQKPGESPKITTDRFGLERGAQAWIQQADPQARVPLAEDRPPEERRRNQRGTIDVLFALAVVLISTIAGVGLIIGWKSMLAATVLTLTVVGYRYLKRSRRPRPLTLADEIHHQVVTAVQASARHHVPG